MAILLSEIILSGTCYTPLPDGEQKLEKNPRKRGRPTNKALKTAVLGGERSKRSQGR